MAEFGLTALARTKLPKLKAPEEDSPLVSFMKNKNKEVR